MYVSNKGNKSKKGLYVEKTKKRNWESMRLCAYMIASLTKAVGSTGVGKREGDVVNDAGWWWGWWIGNGVRGRIGSWGSMGDGAEVGNGGVQWFEDMIGDVGGGGGDGVVIVLGVIEMGSMGGAL